MPVIALGTAQLGLMSRMLRSSLLEVLNQDYIRTARSKGLSEQIVLYRHASKNALAPVITIVAISFAQALGGSISIEFVFGLPGLGQPNTRCHQLEGLSPDPGDHLRDGLCFRLSQLDRRSDVCAG